MYGLLGQLLTAALKIKLSKCSFFKEQMHYSGHLVSGTSIFPLADKIKTLMKPKPPTNVKEVRHFLGLTGYYHKFICSCADIAQPLNCLTYKSESFILTPECQASFDMLWSRLTNTPIVCLPDPSKPYLPFTDASKFFFGILTQASTKECNEAHKRMITSETSLTTIESQTQDLELPSSVVHPVAYISASFSPSQCRWSAISKEWFSVFMSIKKSSLYLQNADLLIWSDHKLLLKIFTGHTDNDECNIWDLETAAIPRRVKVQHIKRISQHPHRFSIKTKSSGHLPHCHPRWWSTGVQYTFGTLPPVEPVTHTPLEVNEIVIMSDIKRFTQNFDPLHDLPKKQTREDKLSLENASPADIPTAQRKLDVAARINTR